MKSHHTPSYNNQNLKSHHTHSTSILQKFEKSSHSSYKHPTRILQKFENSTKILQKFEKSSHSSYKHPTKKFYHTHPTRILQQFFSTLWKCRMQHEICCICLENFRTDSYWKCRRCSCRLHRVCQSKWSEKCPQCQLQTKMITFDLLTQIWLALLLTLIFIKALTFF